MKILLFGVRGLLGTALKDVCFEKKIKLYSYTSKELNVVNFEAIEKKIKKIKPKIIINASALVGIDQCEKNFNKAFSISSIGALNLSRICSEMNITFIQISTHAVFDGSQDQAIMKMIYQSQIMFMLEQNCYLSFLQNQFVKNIIL